MTNEDKMETYAIFLYADGEIQWTTGNDDGGSNGLGGNVARIGFNERGGTRYAEIAISGTTDVLNIESSKNAIGSSDGVYIFKISDSSIPVLHSKREYV